MKPLGDIVMANLGWDEVRLPNPLFEGDTIYSTSEVVETRESRSRQNVGIATVRTTGFNQESRQNVGIATVRTTGFNQGGKPVIAFRRTVLVYRRGSGSSIPRVAS
jgi:acyl dehydratase